MCWADSGNTAHGIKARIGEQANLFGSNRSSRNANFCLLVGQFVCPSPDFPLLSIFIFLARIHFKSTQSNQREISLKYFVLLVCKDLKCVFIYLDCIGVNGGGRRTIIELPNGEIPYGITITENNILWTDWKK